MKAWRHSGTQVAFCCFTCSYIIIVASMGAAHQVHDLTTIYAILEFLWLTPNLVNCCLDDCFWGYHIAEPPPEFPRISNLLLLHLVQITRDSGLLIFQYITLPFLHDIMFDIYDMVEWPQEDFMGFLLRSACPLERLTLLQVLLTLQDLTVFTSFTLTTGIGDWQSTHPQGRGRGSPTNSKWWATLVTHPWGAVGGNRATDFTPAAAGHQIWSFGLPQ